MKRGEKPQELHSRAYAMFIEGKSIAQIAKELKLARQTIFKWKKDEKWDEGVANISKKVRAKIEDDEASIRASDMKICKAIIGRFTQQLISNPDQKITITDVINTMRHRMNLAGMATDKTEVEFTLTDLFKNLKLEK